MSNLLQGAYNTTASVGSAFSYTELAVGIFFSVLLIIIGLVFVIKKPIPDDSAKNGKNAANGYFGGSIIAFGLIILFISIISFYLIKKSKPLAAAAGAENIVNVAENIFRKN
jgi:hypothetical protein